MRCVTSGANAVALNLIKPAAVVAAAPRSRKVDHREVEWENVSRYVIASRCRFDSQRHARANTLDASRIQSRRGFFFEASRGFFAKMPTARKEKELERNE